MQQAGVAGIAARGAPVSFRGVRKTYGAAVALNDFNLEIAAGEFLTLLGPSGSGKTTALNVLAGFIDPSGGDIAIGATSIARLPTEKRNIGMVFQNYSLFPHLSVIDNVAFPLRIRKMPKAQALQKAHDALRLVRLDDFAGRMPHQLSGGQRQRVAFARAIVFEPSVLLMDEPLGALDLKLREAMQLEIKQFHRQIGCTVLYVTHDQGEALTMSDRIVVMNHGAIVQVDAPQAMYDRPSCRFVAEFVGLNNILPATAGAGVVTVGGTGITFAAPPGGRVASVALRPEVLRRAQGGDVSFAATVVDGVFFGDVVRYTARIGAEGPSVTFAEHRGGALAPLEPGAAVTLGFSADKAVLLPD
ncbi:MAG: ABC transporter ATP-binding protein [Alphaproteobacteria bacterium]|jgi:putative spermidine/putrescine transport system ATP-binding protein|nr:ABC transporter ATP-binding protein [Alphaproteobacteria bacterium]